MNEYVIIGDLHGQEPKVHYEGYDGLIATGDFCSNVESMRKYMFKALKEKQENDEDDVKWWRLAGKDQAREWIEESLSRGRETLEKLNSFDVPVYTVPGNWDWSEERDTEWEYINQDHFSSLIDDLDNIVNLHNSKEVVDGLDFIGYGLSSAPEYPQYEEDKESLTSEELEEKKISFEEDLEKVSNIFESSDNPVVFLTHNVPFNTKLDKIDNPDSPRDGQHFGSLIARRIIDEYQPLICIGGHMHEYHDKCKVGDTVVVNAGFGSKANTYLKIEDEQIKSLEFYK